MINNEKNHRFTVVIPTRERCDTLEHSLRTCVTQDYDNLEIIVGDNCSQDRTREVVESFGDSRIRYVNTGKRVCMTDNFEFALSHVRPEGYVIYIGDDDGLLPNAISDMNSVINQTGTQVLRWESASFTWPTPDRNDSQRLVIPSLSSKVSVRKSATVIQKLLSFRGHFKSLPMIYMRSAVDYQIIKRISKHTGKFFHSMVPDVYSGFAIAGSVESYVDSKRPYGLVGSSHHSIGANPIGSPLRAPARKYLSEDNPPPHPDLVFVAGSLPLVIADCFLQARDRLPGMNKFTVDMAKMLFAMMQEAALKPQDQYTATKDSVMQIGRMHNIPEAAQKAVAAHPKRELGSGRKLTLRNIARACLQMMRLFATDLNQSGLYLNCSSMNINNIYDASLLCSHIFKLKDMKYLGRSAVLHSSLSNINRIIFPQKPQSHPASCGTDASPVKLRVKKKDAA